MYERFTERARKVMQLANEEAQRFNHEYIGTEHILLGLVKEGGGVAANVLKNLHIDLRKIRQEIEKIVQSGPEMVKMGKLPQTPRAKKVIEYSIEEARNLDHNYVGTEHVLLGLLRETEGLAAQVLMNLGLGLDSVRDEVLTLLGAGLPPASASTLKTPALHKFGNDLTELARQNKLDPMVGREDEIERVFQILARRARNNPLLVGDSGVGKSALTHGLAQRLAADANCRWTPFRRVIGLDASWCASAEEGLALRRKEMVSIVEEVQLAKDVLLVLDDFARWAALPYTLAPLAAGVMRGSIQCLAVVLSDSDALPCFAPVRIAPLSKAATLPVLTALRDRYGAHHCVEITDEALRITVEMSDSVPGGRQLPGVAVDILDEACARVRLRAGPPPLPPGAAEFYARIARLNQDKEQAVFVQDCEKAAACFAEVDALKRERESGTRETNGPIVGRVDAAVVAEVVRLMIGTRG
jgi:ATP-dependent Clp protease ATP-binding subunit ClpC